jgi:AraC-like DNA-binding protein
MSAHYREYAPHATLATLVRCYWVIRGEGAPDDTRVNRVMPDGCMDVIFDLREQSSDPSRVVGTMLKAAVFQHLGPIDMLGVRFVPGAAPPFLRATASTLTDAVVDGRALGSDISLLADQLQTIHATHERLHRLGQWLLHRLDARRIKPVALQGMALVERSRGQLTVDQLRRALSMTERSLQRVFANEVGLTPKQALRIARFRHALTLLQRTNLPGMAAIAHTCGYADQAHFTREFGALAVTTPGQFLRERSIVGFVQDAPEHAG